TGRRRRPGRRCGSATRTTSGWRGRPLFPRAPSWCAAKPRRGGALRGGAVAGPAANPAPPAGSGPSRNFPNARDAKTAAPDRTPRGLYTYWQRTFPHPSLVAFDAPSREECTADRTRSNTPQQALVLLNDPTYVEAARALAERLARGGGAAERVQA